MPPIATQTCKEASQASAITLKDREDPRILVVVDQVDQATPVALGLKDLLRTTLEALRPTTQAQALPTIQVAQLHTQPAVDRPTLEVLDTPALKTRLATQAQDLQHRTPVALLKVLTPETLIHPPATQALGLTRRMMSQDQTIPKARVAKAKVTRQVNPMDPVSLLGAMEGPYNPTGSICHQEIRLTTLYRSWATPVLESDSQR